MKHFVRRIAAVSVAALCLCFRPRHYVYISDLLTLVFACVLFLRAKHSPPLAIYSVPF